MNVTRPRRAPARLACALGLTLTTAVLLAACSSSGTSGGKSTSAGDAKSAAAGGVNVAALTTELAPFVTPPKTIAVTDLLTKRPTGKSVVFIGPSDGPCTEQYNGLATALTKLGIQHKAIQVDGTPEKLQNAAQQAVDGAPDLIASCAIDPTLIKSQIAEMHSKNIPLVTWGLSQRPATAAAFFQGPKVIEAVATALARYIILKSGGNAHLLLVNQSILSFTADYTATIRRTLKAECTKCTYSSIDSLPSDNGSAIPAKVTSALQRDPKLNWITYAYGQMSQGVQEALAAAGIGSQVQTVTQSPAPNNYAAVKAGTEQATFVNNYGYFQYYVADTIARILVGQKIPDLENHVFSYLVQKKDLANVDVKTQTWNPLPGYQQQFAKLWGIAS